MRKFAYFVFALLFSLSLNASPSILIQMVEAPTKRLTNRWTFIVDGSSSLWTEALQNKCRLLEKSNAAFKYATSFPTDELRFNAYLFAGDAWQEKHAYRDWANANLNEFAATRKWMNDNFGWDKLGLYSHGKESIRLALHQKEPNLTIIIITDGGYTSACNGEGYSKITKTIADGQKWRIVNGYPSAIIATIGIENLHYFGGGKPTDKDCQAHLRKVGKTNNGGYWHVSVNH